MKLKKGMISLSLSLLMVICQIPFQQCLSAKAVSDNTQTKRIIVSLGDSYSSGEGIEPFYGQDVVISKLRELATQDPDQDILDWLAHRSEQCWAGMLELPGVSGTMSEHRDENWFFVAASGAETKHLGVDVDYLEKVEKMLKAKIEAESNIQIDDAENRYFQSSDIKRLNMQSQINTVKNKWKTDKDEKNKQQDKSYYVPYYTDRFGELQMYPTEDGSEDWLSDTFGLPYQLDVFNNIEAGSIDYVTLTLSGNDIGFTEIVKQAVIETITDPFIDSTKNSYYLDSPVSTPNVAIAPNNLTQMLNYKLQLFDSTVSYRLMATYIAIQDRAGQDAKIIVAGYPKLLNANGSALFSKEASQQIDKCDLIFNNKIEQLIEDCRTYANLNIYFVPVVELFNGHEAGTSDPYLNYIMLTQAQDIDQSELISDYSIHPNEKGAKAYADAVQNKLNELENNGIISGVIYKERPDVTVKDVSSRIEKITAVNYDTGYKKSVYVNQSKNTTFGKQSINTNEDAGWSKLETADLFYYSEDHIYSTGHYEMVLPPGNYQLDVSCCDGSQFTLMDANNPEQAAVMEVEARDVIKKQNIYLTEQELGEPNNSYTWELEPSIEADDIIVVDLEHEEDYSTKKDYKYSVVKQCAFIKRNSKYGIIDINGDLLCEPVYSNYSRYFGMSELSVYNDSDRQVDTFTIRSGNEGFEINPLPGGRGDMTEFVYYEPIHNELWVETSNSLIRFSDYYKGSVFRDDYYKTDKCFTVTEIVDPVFDDHGELDMSYIDKEHSGKYGIANRNGLIVPCEYDDCRHYEDYVYGTHAFSECCALKKDGKWAYFDSNGNQITDLNINSSYDFYSVYDNSSESTVFLPTEGMIAIKTDEGAGFIDINGKEVIPRGTFAEARPVHNGLAWVKDISTGLWGVIRLEQAEQPVDTEPEIQETSESMEWKPIYREKLMQVLKENMGNYDAAFDLVDLNQDGIPELLISLYTAHFATVDMYSVYNRELTLIDSIGTYGELQYNHSYNCIAINSAQMGTECYDIYQIQSNSLVSLIHAIDNESKLSDVDADYTLNDLSVDKETYYSALAEYGITSLYDNDGYFSYGRSYSMDYDVISNLFPVDDTVPSNEQNGNSSSNLSAEEAEFVGLWKGKSYYGDGKDVTSEVMRNSNEFYEENLSFSEFIEFEINADHTGTLYQRNRRKQYVSNWTLNGKTIVLTNNEDTDEIYTLEKVDAKTLKVTWGDDDKYILLEKSS